MRKLLLTLAACAAIAPAFAQSSVNSVVFNQKANAIPMGEKVEMASLKKSANTAGANKTTAGGSDWFYMADLLSSTQSKLYYNVMAPDSNIVYPGSTGNVNVFMHGMGHSFDPTDSAYFSEATSMGALQDATAIPSFRVTTGNAYTIDSIAFLSKFMKTTADDDTLVIQVAKTTF